MRAPAGAGRFSLLAVCCSLLSSGVGRAQVRESGASSASPRALELKDYYRIETANAPAISPDGKRVAFVRTYLVENENRRQSEIWLAPADGSAPATRITNAAFNATDPHWSPDGSLLAHLAPPLARRKCGFDRRQLHLVSAHGRARR